MPVLWLDLGRPCPRAWLPGVRAAQFRLSRLAEQGVVSASAFAQFQATTGWADVGWRAFAQPEAWQRGEPRGTVVFVHGWDGDGRIWEDLPAQVARALPHALVLAPDVNGFGQSPFQDPGHVGLDETAPPALMRALERWLALIGLGPGPEHAVLWVGHSMGGAALFYAHPAPTSARLALAPALLLNDVLRKGFYQAMGMGIWAGQMLERLLTTLSPLVVERLIGGASDYVKTVHEEVFRATPKRVLAAAFFALARAEPPPMHEDARRHLEVLLGHRDRLVGLMPMLDLLAELGLPARHVRVLFGDHYFFSVGHLYPRWHQEGRTFVFTRILHWWDRLTELAHPV